MAEAVTSQDQQAIPKPTLNPNTYDFRSDQSAVVLLSDPLATEEGGRRRRR
jgi:hypothetical protein